MASTSGNIDVVLDTSDRNVPRCSHGPALLFERFVEKGARQFFACSAFRDRKHCSFFQWADAGNKDMPENKCSAVLPDCSPFDQTSLRKRFLKFKKLPLSKRNLCCDCGLLLLPGEAKQHLQKGHQVKSGIKQTEMKRPTTLFVPKDDNKTYAQYLFSNAAVEFILQCLEKRNFTHVLCVGTPRVHEAITLQKKLKGTTLTSFLLDLDLRFAQVYPAKHFCQYNMFNHHFFHHQGENRLRAFLHDGGTQVVLLTDPPFGGRVEPFAASLQKIEETWRAEASTNESLTVLWFFPYFMEKRVCEVMPSLTMLDYKVDYDNHTLFQRDKRKKGSPVRIFTNLPPDSLPLPVTEGYWFCNDCKRYSAPENQHCPKCNSCTSKDGTTYRHCDLCQRCVKSTRVHCKQCMTCELSGHICGQNRGKGCHICGAMDHKRANCPQRHNSSSGQRSANMKRPASKHVSKETKKRHRE